MIYAVALRVLCELRAQARLATARAVSAQWLLFDFGERVAVIDAAKQAVHRIEHRFTEAHQQRNDAVQGPAVLEAYAQRAPLLSVSALVPGQRASGDLREVKAVATW